MTMIFGTLSSLNYHNNPYNPMTTPQHRIAHKYGCVLKEVLHHRGPDRHGGTKKYLRMAIIYLSWAKMKAHEYEAWRNENNIDMDAHNKVIRSMRDTWADNPAFKKLIADCTRIFNGDPTLAEVEG